MEVAILSSEKKAVRLVAGSTSVAGGLGTMPMTVGGGGGGSLQLWQLPLPESATVPPGAVTNCQS